MDFNRQSSPRISRTRYYDLVVAGAGPAGAFTAALAAKAGLSVLLLEKKKIPREKVCGGFISARALELLPSDFHLPQTAVPVNTVRVYSRGHSYSFSAGKPLGIVIQRACFDWQLIDYAVRCGVRLQQATVLEEIKAQKNKDQPASAFRLQLSCFNQATHVHTRYLVGADGARGSTAVLAGLRRPPRRPAFAGRGYSCIIPAPQQQEQCASFYPLPLLGGMGWLFPGKGWTNLGVGGLSTYSRLRKQFNRLFPKAAEEGKIKSWPLPFTGPLQKVAAGNLLLVGDAAGLVDPFSGEGVYHALKSAVLAGEAITASQDGQTTAGAVYNRLFKSCFRKSFPLSLAGTALYHTLAVASPALLPRSIASIMQNRHWYRHRLPGGLYGLESVETEVPS